MAETGTEEEAVKPIGMMSANGEKEGASDTDSRQHTNQDTDRERQSKPLY